jgi:hypothetical protein
MAQDGQTRSDGIKPKSPRLSKSTGARMLTPKTPPKKPASPTPSNGGNAKAKPKPKSALPGSRSTGSGPGMTQQTQGPTHNIHISVKTHAPSDPAFPSVPAAQTGPAVQPAKPKKKKPPTPKKPAKEPPLPKDVKLARKRQTEVLKERMHRETHGQIKGGPRDVDAGAGFWPPLSPLL